MSSTFLKGWGNAQGNRFRLLLMDAKQGGHFHSQQVLPMLLWRNPETAQCDEPATWPAKVTSYPHEHAAAAPTQAALSPHHSLVLTPYHSAPIPRLSPSSVQQVYLAWSLPEILHGTKPLCRKGSRRQPQPQTTVTSAHWCFKQKTHATCFT